MLSTEMTSPYDDLEHKTIAEILREINGQDSCVASVVNKAIPRIASLAEAIVPRMKKGGRMVYVGAGTSGRLGVLDASECPPTFGVPADWVIGLIAGGETALRNAVENAEDDVSQASVDLEELGFNKWDTVVGIAASGQTPYVLGAIAHASQKRLLTGCIVCNEGTPIAAAVNFPIEVVTGAEYVTGSTRMKAGTAQKMVLNMLSTTIMIQLGRVKGNKMIDMKMSNRKLRSRAISMVMAELKVDEKTAAELILEKGSVRLAIDSRR